MRTLKMIVISFISMAVFLISSNVPSVEAGKYLGKKCFLVTHTNTDIADLTLRLGVSEEYAGHYVVNGKAEYPAWGAVGMAHGNGEIVGTNIILGLEVIASDAEGTWHAFYRAVLDFGLNGTYNGIQTGWDFGELPHLTEMTGTFTLINCP